MSNRFYSSRPTAIWRVAGQAMVEYTIVLAFGVMVLYGPGGDVIEELEEVFRNNYRGYSYAMSLSALPDFGNGEEYRNYIEDLQLDPALDDATLDRLAVDPGVIVKSGVQAVESSGDLIDPCHLDTIFKFNSSNHLGQVVEST